MMGFFLVTLQLITMWIWTFDYYVDMDILCGYGHLFIHPTVGTDDCSNFHLYPALQNKDYRIIAILHLTQKGQKNKNKQNNTSQMKTA